MRLSDADRDRMIGQLSEHAAVGRLSVQELERRIELVVRADTQEAAREALAELPPPPAPRRRRPIGLGRGHGDVEAPEPGWEATRERFRDPRSGRIMRVWLDAAGTRHYVPEPVEG